VKFGQVALNRAGEKAAGVGLVCHFPLVVAMAQVLEHFSHPQDSAFGRHRVSPAFWKKGESFRFCEQTLMQSLCQKADKAPCRR
jgi:hypothetical protein